MPAYMSFSAVCDYKHGIDSNIMFRHCEQIDGSLWLPTSYLKSIMSDDAFRHMECHVTTWIPDLSITDEQREAHRQEQAELELMCGGYDTSDCL